MSLKITPALAMSMVSAVTNAVDVGPEASELIIWEGDAPDSAAEDVAPTSKILVRFNLPNPAFGSPMQIDNSIEALAYSLPPVSAAEAGEAQFFRLYDGNGDVVLQGLVGEADSALVLNQDNITEGADVAVERLVVGINLG